jgi:sugar lactone lactonase YvrE
VTAARTEAEVVVRASCQLGEGSLWDVEQALLYWVDIVGQRVFAYDPVEGSNVEYFVSEDVGTVVVARNGKLVLGLRSGVASFDPSTGQVTPLVAPEPQKPGNRLNDGKCDPRGRFWVGSMVEDGLRGNGALYCVEPSLDTSCKLTGIDCSNGLVWTGDQSTFYYIDTPTQRVRGFDFDANSGALSNERVVFELPIEQGSPDGMTIDTDDHLWLALWGGHQVLRVDPGTGRVVYAVDVPAERVTSCAFGGADLGELYITTARIGASPDQLRAQPQAGSLFRARVPFRGVPAARFARDV